MLLIIEISFFFMVEVASYIGILLGLLLLAKKYEHRLGCMIRTQEHTNFLKISAR